MIANRVLTYHSGATKMCGKGGVSGEGPGTLWGPSPGPSHRFWSDSYHSAPAREGAAYGYEARIRRLEVLLVPRH